MADEDKVKQLLTRVDRLFDEEERYNAERLWDELSEFMLNNQYGFITSNTATTTDLSSLANSSPGAKRTKRVYDSTALKAVQDLSSAIHGTVTNPATKWSSLRNQQEDLNDNDEVVRYLQEVNDRIHIELAESNFNTEIGKAYQSFVALANMVLFMESRNDENTGAFQGFRFTSVHLSQIAWAENKDGQVDTIFRKFEYTARQAVDRWGNEVSDEILKAYEKEPDRVFTFVHCVHPRDKKDIKLNELGLAPGDKRPIASLYIDLSSKKLVEESGYYEMPIFAVRWSTMPGEKYGRGPSHYALPDTRTLNKLKMRGLESIDLQVRPPIFANQRDIFGSLDLRPGAVNVLRDIKGVTEFRSASRTDVLQFSIQDLQTSIKEIFFLDKLLLPPRTETGEMTAFEVAQRIEQMQRVLGPTLSRLNSELLQPLIVRAFKTLLRSGQLPEAPQILQERGIDVEIVFVNQLARAQQIQDVTNIQQWVQNVAGLAQIKPEVVDNINSDGIARHVAKVLGVPEEAVLPRDVVDQQRQARAQAAQQAQQLEAGVKAADIASKVGDQTGGQ